MTGQTDHWKRRRYNKRNEFFHHYHQLSLSSRCRYHWSFDATITVSPSSSSSNNLVLNNNFSVQTAEYLLRVCPSERGHCELIQVDESSHTKAKVYRKMIHRLLNILPISTYPTYFFYSPMRKSGSLSEKKVAGLEEVKPKFKHISSRLRVHFKPTRCRDNQILSIKSIKK